MISSTDLNSYSLPSYRENTERSDTHSSQLFSSFFQSRATAVHVVAALNVPHERSPTLTQPLLSIHLIRSSQTFTPCVRQE